MWKNRKYGALIRRRGGKIIKGGMDNEYVMVLIIQILLEPIPLARL